ncbi:hypothetical protein PMI42_01684 [Bradyrhizobium sp. YR681]|uniref:hypothetical protein n=1 Tax=Bradyrhizobium sp. YR681 TaxID=1144344 RepID=UPI0002712A37|nr:hypothetical protein [Bradyrhizobium sp. YR681]EJN14711.1 hypothetical protein PMI42_01684 [Bradyrhizobium sp. YR681]
MTSVDLVNWAFAYVLIGTVIWMLLFSAGAMDKAFRYSAVVCVLVSAGAIFAWPMLAVVFFAGMWQAMQRRRARS